MDKELYIVNELGEVIDTIDPNQHYTKLSHGDKVLRKGSISYLQETIDIKYHFVKINPIKFDLYCKKYSILPTLICRIGYLDNVCEFENGKPLNMKNISNVCDVSKSTIKRQINGMVRDDILHKIKNGKETCFMINPWLCVRGRRILLTTYEEFKQSVLRNEVEE